MTSFSVLESSVDSSRPIEIYEFTIGSETFRYTSYAASVTVGINTYTPISLTRTAIGQGREERRRNVTITMPASNTFAQQFVNIIPGQRASVTIMRLQRDESPTFNTQALIFKGQVNTVRFTEDGNSVQIITRSLEAATSRQIPRFTFKGMCNHILFDQRCKVDPGNPSFSVVGSASGTSGNVITVVGANSQADGWWVGGYCKPSAQSDFRLIIGHSGNDLTLMLPFADNPVGSNIQVFAGCDHVLTSHCATKFDNVLEFGGFAFVPNKNPFSTGLD